MKPLQPWQKGIIATVGVLVIFGLIFFLYLRSFRLQSQQKPSTTPPPQTQNPPAPKAPAPSTTEQIFYPISNYNQRLTFRYYGLYVTPAQKAQPCGASFTGYHTGDDLEIFTNEVNTPVPVYAISNSTVRQIGPVSGYGGLIVLGTTINNQAYTIYYGHINLASTNLRVGDNITAGEKLANLGAECSTQTDGERKHLHFAIHKGTTIDERGYVQTKAELANWVNPKEFLIQNMAKPI